MAGTREQLQGGGWPTAALLRGFGRSVYLRYILLAGGYDANGEQS